MHLYVVRHGQTDWNVKKLLQGVTDSPLNDKGKEQAKETAKKLADIEFDTIYSSPLSRAKETCEIIIAHNKKGGKILFDDRIKERDFGDYEGSSASDLKNKGHNWWDYNNEFIFPNGESMADITKRTANFLNEIKKINADKKVLLVTHGGVARVIYYMFNEKPKSGNLLEYIAGNAEVIEYNI